MSCTHTRTIRLYLKHNDLAVVNIPHLKIEQDGYIPRLSPLLGGDGTNLTICLDCGQVIGWQPITDQAVANAFDIEQDDEEDTLNTIRAELTGIVSDAFGSEWQESGDAAEFLLNIVNTHPNTLMRLAAKAMLNDVYGECK